MKKLFILNGLILSGLTISAQNWVNNTDNVYASNVQVQSVNYTTNMTNISIQTNVGNSNNSIQSMNRGGRGNNSALSNINLVNDNNPVVQVQTQSTNKPKQQKTVQTNTNPVVNENNGNVFDNNVGKLNENKVNDVNVNTTTQISVNKTTKTAVVDESTNNDFKPIGLSGRDYSNGGKMKKGHIYNFPKADHTKVKHKRKPGFKKVKYHTSKCARW